MKISEDMKIKDVLAVDEHMLDALMWLSPAFERLQYPKLRRAMSGRVTVSQAARIGGVPLAEALYVLNLAAGCDSAELEEELSGYHRNAFEYTESNPPQKPDTIDGLSDEDVRVMFVDVMDEAFRHRDPMSKIAKGLVSLNETKDVLLVRHPFDPIPLRDMFARRGFASWAEERRPSEWFIYFYKPATRTAAAAMAPVAYKVYVMAAGQ